MIRKRFWALGALAFCGVMRGQTPTIAAGGVVNNVTSDNRLCPGVVAAIYGSNFGNSKTGLTVTVGGKQAFVIVVTPGQLAVEIPFELSPGPAPVVVQTAAGSSAPANVMLSAYAPALLTVDPSGKGPGRFLDGMTNNFLGASGATPGQILVIPALGLGQTNPASTTGVAATGQAPTTATATVSVNGEQAKVIYAGAMPNAVGFYQVNFTVPMDLSTGNYPVVLSIGGQSSNTVTLAVTSSGAPAITSLDNGASFAPKSTAAPGTFMTLKGTNLGSTDSLGVYPATSVGGVSVTINGVAAPIFDLIGSGNSINLLAPFELPTSGAVPVQVTTVNGTSASFMLTMAATVPAMFALTDPGKTTRRNAVAIDAATNFTAMPVSMAEALAKAVGLPVDCTAASPAVYCGKPAAAGDTLTVYATGLGAAMSDSGTLATGHVAPADGSVIYSTVATPVVTIGGAAATVLSSAVAQGVAGIYQVKVQIPASTASGDDVPITLTVSGGATDTATIAIQ